MILHIAKRSDWERAAARGSYAPDSLASEGFVHCSTEAQAVDTANRFFRGQRDLVLLLIDPERLRPKLVFEPPANPADERSAQAFPHIYGPINAEAVKDVIEFPCEPDGTFRLPAALSAK